MRTLKKKSAKPARIPRAGNAPQPAAPNALIDACISRPAYLRSRRERTVEKVVAHRENVSRHRAISYFASKSGHAGRLPSILSAEFEGAASGGPVARLKSRPVAALELMVELYLDP